MRRITFAILSLLFLASCGQEPVAPTVHEVHARAALAATSTWNTHIETFVLSSVYLDCLDEGVDFNLTAQYRDHDVTSSDGSSLNWSSKVLVLEGSTLVGPVSGTWDIVRTAATAEAGGADNFHINDRTTWRNRTTGQVLYAWLRVHFLIGGDGEVKLDTNPDFTRYCTLQY